MLVLRLHPTTEKVHEDRVKKRVSREGKGVLTKKKKKDCGEDESALQS